MTAAFCPACRHSRNLYDETCATCQVPRPQAGWPVDPMIGRIIDEKYRVDRRLSTGGFGTVFIATQMHGSQELGAVVLKFLHPELAHDPNISKRFVTEARAARELGSPHVVRVFDLGFSDEGVPFMVQEYVVGEGLDQVIKTQGALPIERVVRVGMQIAEAMDEAHGKGILHRDLKPENLRVQQSIQGDFVKVLDFGIARVERGTSAATNSFIGTPRYMAPEQIKQKGVDPRSDIFALGVILFEMLTGEPPILAESEMEYIHLNLMQEPRDVRALRPGIPGALADIVMRMMAKEKDARPASMAIVYAELRGSVSGAATITGIADAASLPLGAARGGEESSRQTGKRDAARLGAGATVSALPRSRTNLIVAAAAGAVLLVGGLVGWGVFAGDADPATAVPMGLLPAGMSTVAPLTSLPQPVATAGPQGPTAAPESVTAAPAEPATVRRTKRRPPQPPRQSPGGPRTSGLTKVD